MMFSNDLQSVIFIIIAIRQKPLLIHSYASIDKILYLTYVLTMNHLSGMHDDRVMPTGLGMFDLQT